MTFSESNVIALVGCPKCGVRKGQRCVYIADRFEKPEYDRTTWRRLPLVLRNAKGTPTKRVHAERRERVWNESRRLRAAQDLADAKAAAPAALIALRDFDRREWEATRDWLRAHAQIFWV